MRAKAFFYVSAGLFLLALSYHLGARSAGAQSPTIEASTADAGGYTVASGRTLYRIGGNGATEVVGNIPGTAPIVAVGWQGQTPGGGAIVGLSNGEYHVKGTSGWQYIGNVFGPTPAQRESFGSVKARYR